MPRKKPERNKNPTPGDYVLDPQEVRDPSTQPLSADEKKLVKRAYQLFDYFADQLREEHMAMHDARAMRQLRQQRSITAPPSNTLNSCIDNVVADQIDNMPEARMAPEREETAKSAEELTDVVSYILYHAGWPGKYHRIMEDAAVTGTGIAEVFWDDDAEDGDGMVNVSAWHPEDFYPDPMYSDIQEGRGCFKVTQTTVAWVEEHYPHVKGFVSGSQKAMELEFSTNTEAPDGDVRTTMLEFWYKRYDAKARRNRVHMAQLAGGALLYSTETGYGVEGGKNEYREGVYAHGMYPFTMFRYRDVFRKPFGTGLVHDYKDTQNAIDRYTKYIDDNARESAIQKHFIRRGSGVNTEDLTNYNKTVIEWDGSNINETISTIQAKPLNGQVFQTMQYLVDTMKQDSGQNQFNRGEGGLGVVAASAIQALQEAGGKITRWHTESFKDSFREMVEQIIWVLSEYMLPDRKLRIVGGWDNTENMIDRYIELSAPRADGDRMLKPAYSVRVQVQKNNPLQNQAHNEFVQNVTQVCAQYGKPLAPEVVVRLMRDVPNKTAILKAISESGTMHDQIAQLQAQLEDAQNKIAGRDAVINSQSQALGTPSIAQASAPDYAALNEEQPVEQ